MNIKSNMGEEATTTSTNALIMTDQEPATVSLGWAQLIIQSILIFVPRAFDAQQCFVTAFTDSTSYPSNIISDYSLQNSTSLLTSLPSSSYFAGSISGGFLLTPLSDSILGRKNLLLLSCLLMSLSGILTALFATNLFLYSSLRFASGFGSSSIAACTVVLSAELTPLRWRSKVAVISYVLFSLGFASLPLIAYLNRHSSWRRIYLWISVPVLFYSVVIFFFINESPRWRPLRGANVYSAMRMLVSRKWALWRLILVTMISIGIGTIYYGMPLALGSLSVNLYLSVAMEALVELPASLATFILIGAMGRKSSLLMTTTVCGVFGIACAAVNGSGSSSFALELVAYLGACVGYDLVLIYITELYPTCVRNSAVSMVRQALMVGGVIGAVLVEAGESSKAEFLVYGVVVLVCGVFVVWLPETKGTEICDSMDEEECKLRAGDILPTLS